MRTNPKVKGVAAACVLLIMVGCSVLPELPVGRPINSPPPATAIELEVFDRINEYRRSVNDPPLALEATLVSLAREHSEAMAAGSRPFGHDGFEQRSAIARTALRVTTMSENVAMNNFSPAEVAHEVVEGWIGSPGHLRNLRGAYELTGIGVARSVTGDYFVTQLYAAR